MSAGSDEGTLLGSNFNNQETFASSAQGISNSGGWNANESSKVWTPPFITTGSNEPSILTKVDQVLQQRCAGSTTELKDNSSTNKLLGEHVSQETPDFTPSNSETQWEAQQDDDLAEVLKNLISDYHENPTQIAPQQGGTRDVTHNDVTKNGKLNKEKVVWENSTPPEKVSSNSLPRPPVHVIASSMSEVDEDIFLSSLSGIFGYTEPSEEEAREKLGKEILNLIMLRPEIPLLTYSARKMRKIRCDMGYNQTKSDEMHEALERLQREIVNVAKIWRSYTPYEHISTNDMPSWAEATSKYGKQLIMLIASVANLKRIKVNNEVYRKRGKTFARCVAKK